MNARAISYFDHVEGRKEPLRLTVEPDFSDLPHLEEIILEGHTVTVKRPTLVREHSDGEEG